jgi:hypothetical protein
MLETCMNATHHTVSSSAVEKSPPQLTTPYTAEHASRAPPTVVIEMEERGLLNVSVNDAPCIKIQAPRRRSDMQRRNRRSKSLNII